MQPQQPVPELRRRESWESYSTDGEQNAARPNHPHNPADNSVPVDGGFSQQTVPAPLRVGNGPKPPSFDNNTYGDAVDYPKTSAGGEQEQVPDALRPGAARKETNPFLRNKLAQDSNTPPTEAFANLGMGESDTNPWDPAQRRPPQPPTASSSLYSQPNYQVHGDSASLPPPSFTIDPARPPIPSTQPVFETSDSRANPPFMQSPVDIQENPWSSTTTQFHLPAARPIVPSSTGSTNPFITSPQTSTQPSHQPSPAPMLTNQDPFPEVANANYGHPTPPQPAPIPSPALMSVPSDDEGNLLGVGQDKKGKTPNVGPPASFANRSLPDDDNIWDDLGSTDKGKGKAVNQPSATVPFPADDWNLIDVDSPLGPDKTPQATAHGASSQDQPPLPPRESGENARWTSPRPPIDGQAETYQVKKIRWHDINATENPRTSPILVQNANGPCPLVALVNALSLTTPPNADDASLVTVMRSREQVSLNLLLDAVFEELMSPRRTDADVALPDVSDLYAFLQSLHTGMNVNPRYIPSDAIREAFQHTSLTHLDSSERDKLIPGTFEGTHEMSLYATFKIPLIHGWLPFTSDPAYEALDRQARSYEDAQNLLFREEELDSKLSSPNGLNHSEQELYQDLITIKQFLAESATQLTAWGIQVIEKAMKPGGFAILFRNDHFSTVYCHPQTKQLVTIVTDYGYRSHEEVVWESLVDINGERTQYLSGDFRVVGSADNSGGFGGYSQENGGEWQTVDDRRGRSRQPQQQAGHSNQANEQTMEEPALSAAEQEDRDLALALQLQEEEDQRHREEVARRQREQDLSNRVIEQQGRQPYREPVIRPVSQGLGPGHTTGITGPPRRSSNSVNATSTTSSNPQPPPRPTSQQVRPLIPPRRNIPPRQPEDGGEAPPPYEQAAQDQPYMPPPGHPNHPSSSPAMSRQSTATSARTAPQGPAQIRQGQRFAGQSAGLRPVVQPAGRECTVM